MILVTMGLGNPTESPEKPGWQEKVHLFIKYHAKDFGIKKPQNTSGPRSNWSDSHWQKLLLAGG